MAIPKIIHYCWFGPKPIPELELICMESWKIFFPDYKLMFWNEKTFDIGLYDFTKQAYEKKYYAFVSDFVRANVLCEYGGIYLDTDVEILSDIRPLLIGNNAVLGFENKTFVGTALMAFEANHKILKDFNDHYNNISFVDPSGRVNITANPAILANVLKNHGIILNGLEQNVQGVQVFNRNLFFPKQLSNNKFRTTEETLAIHYFQASWLTERQKRRGRNKFWIEICRPILQKIKSITLGVFGEKRAKQFENRIRNWLK